MSLIYDEYGRPYIIIRDQERKSRLKGLDAQKVSRPWARVHGRWLLQTVCRRAAHNAALDAL